MRINEYILYDDYAEILINSKTFGKFKTKVDLDTLEHLKEVDYSWSIEDNKAEDVFYAKTTIYLGLDENGKVKNKSIELHRFIMNSMGIYTDSTINIDHENTDSLDNRKFNLRVITASQNNRNRKSKNKNNKSGYRNVTWDKRRSKWIVQLQVEGKNKCLGKFDDVDEAGEFAKKMRDKYYGEFAGKG